MNPGELRHRVSIQNAVITTVNGDAVPEYLTVAERWAKIEPTGGGEDFTAEQTRATRNHTVTLRYYPLKPSDRLVFGSRIFNVESVLNEDERNRLITVSCLEVF